MAQALEIVQFRVRPEREREYVAGHAGAIQAIAAAFPGLIRVARRPASLASVA